MMSPLGSVPSSVSATVTPATFLHVTSACYADSWRWPSTQEDQTHRNERTPPAGMATLEGSGEGGARALLTQLKGNSEQGFSLDLGPSQSQQRRRETVQRRGRPGCLLTGQSGGRRREYKNLGEVG